MVQGRDHLGRVGCHQAGTRDVAVRDGGDHPGQQPELPPEHPVDDHHVVRVAEQFCRLVKASRHQGLAVSSLPVGSSGGPASCQS